MKLQRLRELANGTTPLCWTLADNTEVCAISDQLNNGYMIADCMGTQSIANAAYIAAACPANILPFLESYEELLALLKVSACPCCDGQGAFYDNYDQVCQCQFCDERAKAITNAEKLK